MTVTATDLARHLVADGRGTPRPSYRYRFPNGLTASVIPDPHPDAPFRFEICTDAPQYANRGGVVGYLSTDDVEAVLVRIAESKR